MSAAWYPLAQKLDQGRTGGSMLGGPARATLHDTETRSWAGEANYHMVLRQVGEVVVMRQYRPFNMAARGLRNLSGGVQTNRQGSVHLQVSVVGYAKDAPHSGAWTEQMYDALREFSVWAEEEWGVPRIANVPGVGGGEGFGYRGAYRFTFEEWLAYTGWAAHTNVPENTHWDVGRFDWAKMLSITESDDMFTKRGDKGDKVEYWQRRILRIDASALPRFGADADYGLETQNAVARMVPGSDGSRIGPLAAEHLDAKAAYGQDLSGYASKADLQAAARDTEAIYAKKGTYGIVLDGAVEVR